MRVIVTRADTPSAESVCVPKLGQDPADCAKHDHVTGRRPSPMLHLTVVDDVNPDSVHELVGRRMRLVLGS